MIPQIPTLRMEEMKFDDYKVVLYRNQPHGWIPGCHALMPTAEGALAELAQVFQIIGREHREEGKTLPRDSTEIVHA